MRDIQSGNRVVESLFDMCEVDAELLVDPVVAQGVAGGQERVDLYSLMIGGHEDRALRGQVEGRHTVIQRDPTAKSPGPLRVAKRERLLPPVTPTRQARELRPRWAQRNHRAGRLPFRLHRAPFPNGRMLSQSPIRLVDAVVWRVA